MIDKLKREQILDEVVNKLIEESHTYKEIFARGAANSTIKALQEVFIDGLDYAISVVSKMVESNA